MKLFMSGKKNIAIITVLIMSVAALAGLFTLLPMESRAAGNIHYVLQGSNGDGSSWANAYGQLPSVLVRGDTYYIGDGYYPAYTFDDPESGTSTITIKKATASDHGTDVGWQPSYGDGQAVFNSTLVFTRSYYVMDGQVRNEDDWFDGNSYGFRIEHNNKDQNIIIETYGSTAASNITIRNVFINAIYGNLPDYTIRRYAIDTDTYGGPTHTGLVFSRMYVYGSNNVWFLRNTNGAIVEYCASNGVVNNHANHGEIVNLFYSGNNAIVRFNKFKNAYIGAGGTALVAITYAHGLRFYGNVCWNFDVGDGAVGFAGGDASNCRIFNNTFVGGHGWNSGFVSDGTNNLVYNNLWINNRTVNVQGTHNYNGFSDSNPRGESNAQINIPTSIFVNYNENDFRLSQPTLAGITLDAPYNTDMYGNIRGADGVWDRGAYEYVSGGSTPTPTPTPAEQTIFTTQTPTQYFNDTRYELGTRFKTTVNGKVMKVRIYTNSVEGGVHNVRLWKADGTLVSGPHSWNITPGTPGWKVFTLPSPVSITAGVDYIVAVSNSTDNYWSVTVNGFDSPINNDNLITYVGSGVYTKTLGTMPAQVYSNSNYFRDVVFEAD